MLLDPETEWECPSCGEVLHFIGEATKKINIDQHRWEHARQARLATAEHRRAEEQEQITAGREGFNYHGPIQVPPLDELFFEGTRLSAFDITFLGNVKVCWNRNSLLDSSYRSQL